MATTYVTMENLTRYDSNLKAYIDSAKTKGFKYLDVKDNKINFYVDPAPTETTVADFSVEIPVEYFLDQLKTEFVQEFAWSVDLYPESTDPSLEGKPVLVLAVKGDDESVSYSFLNMETLVDVYTGEETDTVSTTVSSDNKISAEVKLSAEAGNMIEVKVDGLYAPETDISGKADKLVNPETGDAIIKEAQILVDDGNGNLAASGMTIDELKTEIMDEFNPMTDDAIDDLFK